MALDFVFGAMNIRSYGKSLPIHTAEFKNLISNSRKSYCSLIQQKFKSLIYHKSIDLSQIKITNCVHYCRFQIIN